MDDGTAAVLLIKPDAGKGCFMVFYGDAMLRAYIFFSQSRR